MPSGARSQKRGATWAVALAITFVLALYGALRPTPAPPVDATVLRRLDALERAVGNTRTITADHERRLTVLETEVLLTTGERGGKR